MRIVFFVSDGKKTLSLGHIIAKVAHRDPIKKIKSNINNKKGIIPWQRFTESEPNSVAR